MKVVLFRNHPKDGGYDKDYRQLQGRLVGIVSKLPGFISVEQFSAVDGEVLILAKFDSDEALAQWRDHPDHRDAQGKRGDFYSGYSVQVCSLDREYGWQAK